MLALQRRTDPILTKTVIRELAHDAAPSMRFTKSAREALQYAVEAYAQGVFLFYTACPATYTWHAGVLCSGLTSVDRPGVFEASNTIRGCSDEKTLSSKHLKAALQMPALLTGNGHPEFRLTA